LRSAGLNALKFQFEVFVFNHFFYHSLHFLGWVHRGSLSKLARSDPLKFSLCSGRSMGIVGLLLAQSAVVVVCVGSVIATPELHGDVFVGVSNSFRAKYGCSIRHFKQRFNAV
jgi:hypothetical protein